MRGWVNKGKKKDRSCYHAPALTLSLPSYTYASYYSGLRSRRLLLGVASLSGWPHGLTY